MPPVALPTPTIESQVDREERERSEHQREQIRLRGLWDGHMENQAKWIHYKQTVVMMLSWKDSDLNKVALKKEIKDLSGVFENKYGYKVIRHRINSRKNPKKWLNKYLSNFVCKYDKEDTLLIIYYAGHGWSKLVSNTNGSSEKQFHLADKGTADVASLDEQCRVAWHQAERILMGVDSADILGIFDCCDAGSLVNLRGGMRFEYLGACAAGDTTHRAGPKSFTRALIWALNEFATSKKLFFTTSELQKKIALEAPDFPEYQAPSIGQRVTKPDYITLAPRRTEKEAKDLGALNEPRASKWAPTGTLLNLQFQFDSEIPDAKLEKIAKALHTLIAQGNLEAKRIAFLEKHEVKSTKWLRAVHKALEQKRLAKRSKILTPPPSDGSQPSSGSEGETLLSLASVVDDAQTTHTVKASAKADKKRKRESKNADLPPTAKADEPPKKRATPRSKR